MLPPPPRRAVRASASGHLCSCLYLCLTELPTTASKQPASTSVAARRTSLHPPTHPPTQPASQPASQSASQPVTASRPPIHPPTHRRTHDTSEHSAPPLLSARHSAAPASLALAVWCVLVSSLSSSLPASLSSWPRPADSPAGCVYVPRGWEPATARPPHLAPNPKRFRSLRPAPPRAPRPPPRIRGKRRANQTKPRTRRRRHDDPARTETAAAAGRRETRGVPRVGFRGIKWDECTYLPELDSHEYRLKRVRVPRRPARGLGGRARAF